MMHEIVENILQHYCEQPQVNNDLSNNQNKT